MAETQESGGVATRPATFPPDLVAYVQAGGLVRNAPTDELAGRCGADKSRRAGLTPFCERGAGSGTDHVGVGRCWQHNAGESKYATGLTPWVGTIEEADWLRITGGRTEAGPEGFLTTHGGHSGLKPFEEIMARRLEPEDLETYLNAPLDPLEVITANLRERWMAKDRIYRWLHKLRVETAKARAELMEKLAVENDPARASALRKDIAALARTAEVAVVEVEPTLNRNTAVQARLLEVRARFQELEGTEDARSRIRDVLAGLADEDFARLKSDPVALATLMAHNANH